MKTRVLAATAVALATFTACEQKPAASSAKAEAAQTFDATGRYLDQGGDFYIYLRTEQILEKLPVKMDEWKTAAVQLAGDNPPLPPEQIDAWYGAAKNALLDTGFAQVRAVGMSSVEIEPALHRTRTAIYTGEINDPGMLWKVSGNAAPHAFDMLDFIPSTAIYTVTSDFDATALWAYLDHVIESIPDAAVRAQARQIPAVAEGTLGMPFADFTASLGSEMGLVICADEKETMTIPTGARPMEIPRLAVAIVLRVSDDRLYDLLSKKIDESIGTMIPLRKSDANGVRSVTVDVPAGGLPLAPTVARFGNFLLIATTDVLVQQLARTGDNPPALLKDTEAFKRFASLEKLEGNSLCYMSERGSELLRKIQMQSLNEDGSMPPQIAAQVEKFYDMFSQKWVFSIGRREKDATTGVMYSPHGSEQIVAAAAIVPVAIAAAVAIPNIERARQMQQMMDQQPPAEPDGSATGE